MLRSSSGSLSLSLLPLPAKYWLTGSSERRNGFASSVLSASSSSFVSRRKVLLGCLAWVIVVVFSETVDTVDVRSIITSLKYEVREICCMFLIAFVTWEDGSREDTASEWKWSRRWSQHLNQYPLFLIYISYVCIFYWNNWRVRIQYLHQFGAFFSYTSVVTVTWYKLISQWYLLDKKFCNGHFVM